MDLFVNHPGKKSETAHGVLAPFSSISYWGKILVGVILMTASGTVLMLFIIKLKDQHGGFADFVRLLAWVICGSSALLGLSFLRWAFAERR